MKLNVDGTEYENFTSATAEIRLDALSNSFSFQAATSKATPIPFTGGERCKVVVDDVNVLTGFIELVGGSYSASGHTYYAQGRDKTADLVDSTLSPISDIKGKVSLKAIIEKVIANIGANIDVIDNVNPDLFSESRDVQAPEPGDNAFEFIEKLARKRQVLLTSNSEGNVVIEKTPGAAYSIILQNIIGASDNNVLAANYTNDQTGRFNVYQFKSGLNPFPLNNAGNVEIKTVVNQGGGETDGDIRPGRQLVIVPEGAFTNDISKDRATWEANVRKARGKQYTATVRGFKPTPDATDVWQVNRLITVIDDFYGIDAQMLINSVSFSFDLSGGSVTTLGLVEKNAYQLTLSEPKSQNLGFL